MGRVKGENQGKLKLKSCKNILLINNTRITCRAFHVEQKEERKKPLHKTEDKIRGCYELPLPLAKQESMCVSTVEIVHKITIKAIKQGKEKQTKPSQCTKYV